MQIAEYLNTLGCFIKNMRNVLFVHSRERLNAFILQNVCGRRKLDGFVGWLNFRRNMGYNGRRKCGMSDSEGLWFQLNKIDGHNWQRENPMTNLSFLF